MVPVGTVSDDDATLLIGGEDVRCALMSLVFEIDERHQTRMLFDWRRREGKNSINYFVRTDDVDSDECF